MKELEAIKAEIVVTKEKLEKAETAGNEALIVIYGNLLITQGNILIEQQKEKNIFGNLLIEQQKATNILSTKAGN